MLPGGRPLTLPFSVTLGARCGRYLCHYRHLHRLRSRERRPDSKSQQPARPGPKAGYRLTVGNPGLDEPARKQILRNGSFATWLSDRLDLLAQQSKNEGFGQYLNEFKFSIRTKKLYREKLGDHVVGTGSALLRQPTGSKDPHMLYKALGAVFLVDGERAVDAQLRYSHRATDAGRTLSKMAQEDQKQLADLRYPAEWYPATRSIQRTIHLHVGPTNSGKTYHALKRLEEAESGVYAGPLRLLAHEVYGRLNAKGKTCDLVTGDERIAAARDGLPSKMQSCTVEMIPLNTDFDVAVVDEIQMIGHDQRGWAWTQALLGLRAREVHLCGEERTVPLIRELAASMGDKIELHTYKRLSPLKTSSTSLRGDLTNLRKGDCVVVFSRVGIHAMRRDIEKATQRRVAIVYGSLPPEIRAQQAALFNDPDNDYDFLVASDAIGMGLNLAIKRVIFESLHRFNGFNTEIIETAQIKQIAGRAGRFRVADQAKIETQPDLLTDAPTPNLGLVTTLEQHDLIYVKRAMQTEPDPIMSAGLFPPTDVIEQFAAFFPPETSFSYIMQRLHEIALVHPRFMLCHLKDQTRIADTIQSVEGLTVRDRMTFCAAPASVGAPGTSGRGGGMDVVVRAFAKCVGNGTSGALLEIPELDIGILDEKMTLERGYLDRLEMLHKALILYLWLSYRFAGVFVNQAMGFYVKSLVEQRIDKTLSEFSATKAIQNRIKMMRKKAMESIKQMETQQSSEEPGRKDRAESELNSRSLPNPADDPPIGTPILQGADLKASQMSTVPHVSNTEPSRSFTSLCL